MLGRRKEEEDTVDREILACTNICPLNFRVVFFSSLEHTDEN